eukprot:scaffold110733_cov66-Phaeocystis_antarctica.AAC.2
MARRIRLLTGRDEVLPGRRARRQQAAAGCGGEPSPRDGSSASAQRAVPSDAHRGGQVAARGHEQPAGAPNGGHGSRAIVRGRIQRTLGKQILA